MNASSLPVEMCIRDSNDTYHNEAVIGKVGVIDKQWAARLMFGFTYSNMSQDVQTGVRQDIVYGLSLIHI